MKKISLVLGVLLLCAFAFTGCSEQENIISAQISEIEKVEIGGYTNGSVIDKWDNALGIRFSVSNVTATGLTLICEQSGGKPTGTLQTGNVYWLEKEADGEWEAINPLQNLVWTDEALLIPMNGETEWTLNWSHIYGKLPAGTYRIGKRIMDFRGTGDYDEQAYYAEFEIID